jgi:hypothetical protein
VNPLTGKFIDPGSGRVADFGWDSDSHIEKVYSYLGLILGAVEADNGHIVAFIGMEDGSSDKTPYFVAFQVGDKAVLKDKVSNEVYIDLEGEITTSRDFFDRVSDGRYLNRPIGFWLPIEPNFYSEGLYPRYFPGLVTEVERHLPAIVAFHEMAAELEAGRNISGVETPPFVNAGPDAVADLALDSLPYFFQANIVVKPRPDPTLTP